MPRSISIPIPPSRLILILGVLLALLTMALVAAAAMHGGHVLPPGAMTHDGNPLMTHD